jgi:alpha-mannosidase
MLGALALVLFQTLVGAGAAEPPRQVFVVPNFHPASCGWLANWSVERNYCANSYLDHLDRVRDDANYNFAMSECNNMIAIANFQPQRFAELKQRVQEGRVELVNAFFLEPTINLSGGEALVKMGVEGLRWQQQVLGAKPRMIWAIDVCGLHEQMAQITAGLGLDALVYCRLNPTGSTLHWLESPDGTRTLALSPGHYLEWRPMFSAKMPMTDEQLKKLADDIRARIEPLSPEADKKRPDAGDLRSAPRRTPAGAPVLIFGGSGDYSMAPLCKSYPTEFLAQFKQAAPQYDVQFSTPGKYLDAVLPGIKSGAVQLPTMRGGSGYNYLSFWIQCSRVKETYRLCEHELQGAEMLATIASLKSNDVYPAVQLNRAWLLMCLNMDRNTLWGAAGGMVFESPDSWDVNDRFSCVLAASYAFSHKAMNAMLGSGPETALFNPLNWERNDPAVVSGIGLCRPRLPSCGLGAPTEVDETEEIKVPDVIETKHYSLRIDPQTGALASLKLKPSGREMLGGPANVIVAEKPKKPIGDPGDHMANREDRIAIANTNATSPVITARRGQLGTTVEVRSTFIGGGALVRTIRCYDDYPRIDFETELNDAPDRAVVFAEFPLAEDIAEVRRGIPYGFSHGAWAVTNEALHGWTKGIVPAVRWSHYALAGGGGLALLDRGLSGRELTGRTPLIFLLNTTEKYRGYPTPWLSGKGKHQLRYALVAHDGGWADARIPQLAWEYNCPPQPISGVKLGAPTSFVQTSGNVIVEALRREGDEIELRLAECLGVAGEATVTLNLPHESAARTDLLGGHAQPLAGGPTYKFPVRPQQIVTLRFKTAQAVAAITPLMKWDELVPEHKRAALNQYLPDVKGHPPAGK